MLLASSKCFTTVTFYGFAGLIFHLRPIALSDKSVPLEMPNGACSVSVHFEAQLCQNMLHYILMVLIYFFSSHLKVPPMSGKVLSKKGDARSDTGPQNNILYWLFKGYCYMIKYSAHIQEQRSKKKALLHSKGLL